MSTLESKQVSTARGGRWIVDSRPSRVPTTHLPIRAVLTAPTSQEGWSMGVWLLRERRAREAALSSCSEQAAWRVLNREARRVMRAYTTSFFIVSRFLPRAKRREVEAVYAAVRYPDEVVDTFPLDAGERLRLLDEWGAHYETGIKSATLHEA